MSPVDAPAPDVADEAAPADEGSATESALTANIEKFREGGLDAFRDEEVADNGADPEQPADDPESDVSPGDGDESVAGGDAEDDLDDPAGDVDMDGDLESGDDAADEGELEPGGDDAELEADEAEDDLITIEVEGRREGETSEVRVHPDDEEVVRMHINNGMRRQEFNRQMESVRDAKREIQDFERRLQTDPEGLVLERARPETQESIVRAILLSDDGLLEKFAEELYDYDADPSQKAKARAELERDQAKREAKSVREDQRRKQTDAYAAQIVRSVEGLIPEDMPATEADAFYEDALTYLEVQAHQNPRAVRPDNVRNVLERHLRLYGIADAGADDSNGSTSKRSAASSKPTMKVAGQPTEEAPSTDVEEAKQAGENLSRKSEKKKSSVTAPAGAGATPTRIEPPKGQTVKERIKWLRKNRPNL